MKLFSNKSKNPLKVISECNVVTISINCTLKMTQIFRVTNDNQQRNAHCIILTSLHLSLQLFAFHL